LSAALALSVSAQTLTQAAQDRALAVWSEQAREWIDQQMAQADSGALPLRPEVQIGALDTRLRLAPCARVEPYLPTGTRLWGRSRIGLRCVEGPTAWNLFLPITVKAWGPAWVLRQPVSQGTLVTQEDLEPVEIDWAESSTPVLARTEDWLGFEAARTLMPGQVLRQGMVRAPQVFSAGTPVKVVVRGQGFALSATGSALTHGQIGQTARVRMPNRRVLSGIVRDAETVEISL
jgi:flagella basal body P-ring formation protein FlgA